VSGSTTSYAYDDHGRLATVTASDGYAVTTTFDALDRPTLVTYPDSTTDAITYDKLDPNATRDRLGRWTHYIHDAVRRLVATRDPQGRTVTQKWCNCGVLEQVIDANGNATSWSLDAQNRLIQETRANSGTITQEYETTTSRLKRRTNLKGEHVDFTYFKDNNINAISYPNPGKPTSNVSFTYDTIYNRVATMVDGIGTTSYAYNAITTSPGALGAGALGSINGPLSNDTIAYGYDELGRIVSRGINSVNASMTYDPLGRVDGVTNALGSFGYSYVNQTGRMSSVSYPNGQTTDFGYFNNAGDVRLQEIHNKLSGGATLSKFDYAYDTIGQLTTWTQQRDDGGSAVTRAYDFQYDRAGQLTLADYRTTGGSPTILTRYAYNYDTSGNRTGEQIDDTVLKASYNNMNRMTSRDPGGPLYFAGTVDEASSVTIQGKPATVTADNHFSGTTAVSSGTSSVQVAAKDFSGNVRTNTYQVSQSGSSTSYTYDSNGNLTGDGTRTFEWDAENRLLAVEAGTHRSEFTYDGRGRRVRIVEKVSGSTTSDHWFLWCGNEMCEERDAAGSTVTKRFFGQGVQIGSTNYFYTMDHLGSIREMTDGSAAIQARYDYDPYGRQTKLSGSLDADFGFTGHYEHAPTGLALTKYRAYDPSLGRWLNEDPIGLGGGPNRYVYVSNNPTQNLDPYGLDAVKNPDGSYSFNDFLADASNVSAGGLDALIPIVKLGTFSANTSYRGNLINECSTSYSVGFWTGVLLPLAFTAVEAIGANIVEGMGETEMLRAHMEKAIARYGEEGVTERQANALINRPGLKEAFRGERIDTFFKESVSLDPELSHLDVTPRFRFGPDVYNIETKQWWDVTTPGEWAKHLGKYPSFGEGIPLFTK
jgi:RHS repeat-associated protein